MAAPDRIWLDAQGAQNRLHLDRGIPRYISDHVRSLTALAGDRIRAVALNPTLPLTGNVAWLLGSELLTWSEGRAPSPRPALYHIMSPFELAQPLERVWPPWARTRLIPTVVTLYDVIPAIFPDHYLRNPVLRAQYNARSQIVSGADHILAISETTARDAVERLGARREQITVIDAGVANHFAEAFGSAEQARHLVDRRFPEIRPGFMFYVGGIEFRKNLERTIEAYGATKPAFRAVHQLVLTCRMLTEQETDLRKAARAAGISDGELILTNYVADRELAALYRTCDLFVFPSFYEGSGLPILEAMACGAPVASARSSASLELLGDDRASFDPFDVRDIAHVLQSTLADPGLMEQLRERSAVRVRDYTWQHVAERTLEGYEHALAAARRLGRVRSRPRIAMYTPWPPDRSGIADYNRRLLSELGRDVDVDVVVAKPLRSYPRPLEAGVRLARSDDMAWRHEVRGYDRMVYCMGNSEFHQHVYEALRQRPGVVVAHDVRLTGFFGWYAGVEQPHDPAGRLAERIRSAYRDRLGELFAQRAPTPEEQSSLGIYMTREIQQAAELMIVHSRYAADIVRLDQLPGRAPAAATTVLPLAFPEPSTSARGPSDPSAPTVVTFGIISSVKAPETLIEAFALLARDRPGARLVFAGGAHEAELLRCQRAADEAGVGDKVEFRGFAAEAYWRRLLAEADVAVQLRLVSNGEASAAVTQCLAAGLPTVVTDHGWFAELPREAVVGVPRDVSAPRLAAAIARIIDDPSRASAISEAGREHARCNTFARVARSYLDVLELT
jgi:glycosyltransferase involved in cell wall biosynthesis